eukprot:768207-Hanusia_phi.AAC.3
MALELSRYLTHHPQHLLCLPVRLLGFTRLLPWIQKEKPCELNEFNLAGRAGVQGRFTGQGCAEGRVKEGCSGYRKRLGLLRRQYDGRNMACRNKLGEMQHSDGDAEGSMQRGGERGSREAQDCQDWASCTVQKNIPAEMEGVDLGNPSMMDTAKCHL